MVSSSSSDAYGYLAAFVACLAFGSFCVPMKAKGGSNNVDIDPLVFTSYSTVLLYLTSLCVLRLLDISASFTPWGIISGLFWVPAGVVRVCAVRSAGLVLAQGVASSVTVLVSFSWGIFIFNERVKSTFFACFAILLVIGGISGMSYYSRSHAEQEGSAKNVKEVDLQSYGKLSESDSIETEVREECDTSDDSSVNSTCKEDSTLMDDDSSCFTTVMVYDDDHLLPRVHSTPSIPESIGTIKTSPMFGQSEYAISPKSTRSHHSHHGHHSHALSGTTAMMNVFVRNINRKYKLRVTTRQLGIACAALGGAWCGCIMVPLHYVGDNHQGLNYLYSFAAGALLVNITMWCLLFNHHYERTHSINAAYNALPPLHLRTMAIPGALSGFLQSIGNIGGILSVTYLGEGIGFSITQSSILVNGIWGIFWFREITCKKDIQGWIVAAIVTIMGIIILGLNHIHPNVQPTFIEV